MRYNYRGEKNTMKANSRTFNTGFIILSVVAFITISLARFFVTAALFSEVGEIGLLFFSALNSDGSFFEEKAGSWQGEGIFLTTFGEEVDGEGYPKNAEGTLTIEGKTYDIYLNIEKREIFDASKYRSHSEYLRGGAFDSLIWKVYFEYNAMKKQVTLYVSSDYTKSEPRAHDYAGIILSGA